MFPRITITALLLGLVWSGVAIGQHSIPPAPPPEKGAVNPPLKLEAAPRPPVTEEKSQTTTSRPGNGVLSDLLSVFIFVALIAGLIIALVFAVALFFRLRAAEDPLMAALDDAWVQGRLRELEAAQAANPEAAVDLPVEVEAEVALEQVETH